MVKRKEKKYKEKTERSKMFGKKGEGKSREVLLRKNMLPMRDDIQQRKMEDTEAPG